VEGLHDAHTDLTEGARHEHAPEIRIARAGVAVRRLGHRLQLAKSPLLVSSWLLRHEGRSLVARQGVA